MKEDKRCRCADPNVEGEDTQSAASNPGVVEWVVCGRCSGLVRESSQAEPIDAVEPLVEYEFAASGPRFKDPINYWENGKFNAQSQWLLKKRDRCIQDLRALRAQLGRLQADPPHTKIERAAAFASTLRQASGAFSEMEHTEKLIGLIHPTFDFSALPTVRFERRPKIVSPRRGNYAEERHAA